MEKDFGHIGVIGEHDGHPFSLDKWGVGPFVILAGLKRYRFEDSDMFGPSTIKKNGDFTKEQPKERSPFWDAHRAWVLQGRRLEKDGVTCIYDRVALSAVSPGGRE